MARREEKHKLTPRLVNKTEAAYYCGLNTQMFSGRCPVRPINIGGTTMRYDVAALDKWIEDLGAGPHHISIEETIATMGMMSIGRNRRKRNIRDV